MLILPKILTLIVLCGTPVQLYPTYNPKIVVPKYGGNTSPKSIRFPEQFFRHVYNKPLSSKILKELQYAPLQVVVKSTTTSKKGLIKTTPPYGKILTAHLEPRTDVKREFTKCYHHISGEHVEALSSVSRSPGHNAIYRGYPLVVPRNKPFKAYRCTQDAVQNSMKMKKVLKKLNFIKPYGLPQTLDVLPIATTAVPFLTNNRNEPPVMSNQEYIINTDIAEKVMELGLVKNKRPPFSTKLHRLHLNIARIYSPGAVSQKSPSYSGVYSMNIENEHAKLQADLPPILHLSKKHQITGKSVRQK